MKILNSRQVAVLKRTAQNNYPLNQKLAKIDKQIAELEDEKKVIEAQLQGFEMGAIALTGGYTSGQLIDRVVLPALNEDGTQKTDKDGRILTVTKYVPKAGVLVEQENGSYAIVEPETVEDVQTPGGELYTEEGEGVVVNNENVSEEE